MPCYAKEVFLSTENFPKAVLLPNEAARFHQPGSFSLLCLEIEASECPIDIFDRGRIGFFVLILCQQPDQISQAIIYVVNPKLVGRIVCGYVFDKILVGEVKLNDPIQSLPTGLDRWCRIDRAYPCYR
jgi:hypothetical protein